jgi:phasin family protein
MAENLFNPFANFDLGKFDITKMLGDLKIPGFDMSALLVAQRKNIEALTAANKVALEGMQTIAKRQAEIMAQALTEASGMAQQLASAGSPQEASTRQAELVRQAFEKALANMHELAEMFSKVNTEAFELINKRFTESVEELKTLVTGK